MQIIIFSLIFQTDLSVLILSEKEAEGKNMCRIDLCEAKAKDQNVVEKEGDG